MDKDRINRIKRFGRMIGVRSFGGLKKNERYVTKSELIEKLEKAEVFCQNQIREIISSGVNIPALVYSQNKQRSAFIQIIYKGIDSEETTQEIFLVKPKVEYHHFGTDYD